MQMVRQSNTANGAVPQDRCADQGRMELHAYKLRGSIQAGAEKVAREALKTHQQ